MPEEIPVNIDSKPKKWLSIRQLADRWSVGYETVRQDVLSGKIPYLAVGKARRISLSWVEQKEQKAQAESLRQSRAAARRVNSQSGVDHFADIQ